MSLSPEQQRSIEGLVSQVNVDNVLSVAAILRRQAAEIEDLLNASSQRLQLEPCGNDPISHDAVSMFQPKIDHIVAVHWAHCTELRAAVGALRESALGYGYTDHDLDESFRKLLSA